MTADPSIPRAGIASASVVDDVAVRAEPPTVHVVQKQPGMERSDLMVASMRLGGVEEIFFTSGSELVFLQEATAKARSLGLPTPRLITQVVDLIDGPGVSGDSHRVPSPCRKARPCA